MSVTVVHLADHAFACVFLLSVYSARREADFVMPSPISKCDKSGLAKGAVWPVIAKLPAQAMEQSPGRLRATVQKTNLLRCSHPLDSFG
jgi:hypothetical protein